MAFPIYLAMTAAEIRENSHLPRNFAYMACHFSPYGTGLSNRPQALRSGSLLILNDRTPIHGHGHGLIAAQLEELISKFFCDGVLLDFQRPGCRETDALVRYLTDALPCPVGVSEMYAEELTCPVFMSPVPLDMPVSEYLRPWQGREIWLEAALEGSEITLTPKGYAATSLPFPGESEGFEDDRLHCHYQVHEEKDAAKFTLFRTREDLDALLAEAESLGVTRAVGLWQELGR